MAHNRGHRNKERNGMFKPDSFHFQTEGKDRCRMSEISFSFSFARYVYIWKTNALITLGTHLEI